MLHVRPDEAERAGGHLHAFRFVEGRSGTEMERARDDGHVLGRGMPVRHDLVAVRHLEADHIRSLRRGVALEHGHLGAGLEHGWRGPPFHVRRGRKPMSGLLRGRVSRRRRRGSQRAPCDQGQ